LRLTRLVDVHAAEWGAIGPHQGFAAKKVPRPLV
jgi:hypothetical protein